jgi:hypothetical protein
VGKKIGWDVGVRVEIIPRNQSTRRWGLSDSNLPTAFFNMPWSVGQWVCVFTSLVITISMHRVCWVVPGEVVYGATVLCELSIAAMMGNVRQGSPYHAILAKYWCNPIDTCICIELAGVT